MSKSKRELKARVAFLESVVSLMTTCLQTTHEKVEEALDQQAAIMLEQGTALEDKYLQGE